MCARSRIHIRIHLVFLPCHRRTKHRHTHMHIRHMSSANKHMHTHKHIQHVSSANKHNHTHTHGRRAHTQTNVTTCVRLVLCCHLDAGPGAWQAQVQAGSTSQGAQHTALRPGWPGRHRSHSTSSQAQGMCSCICIACHQYIIRTALAQNKLDPCRGTFCYHRCGGPHRPARISAPGRPTRPHESAHQKQSRQQSRF